MVEIVRFYLNVTKRKEYFKLQNKIEKINFTLYCLWGLVVSFNPLSITPTLQHRRKIKRLSSFESIMPGRHIRSTSLKRSTCPMHMHLSLYHVERACYTLDKTAVHGVVKQQTAEHHDTSSFSASYTTYNSGQQISGFCEP
jgi:hypothetical protein